MQKFFLSRSKADVSIFYLLALTAAPVSYFLYLSGTTKQTIVFHNSLFGYLLAYQFYTSMLFLCIGDFLVSLRLRRFARTKAQETTE